MLESRSLLRQDPKPQFPNGKCVALVVFVVAVLAIASTVVVVWVIPSADEAETGSVNGSVSTNISTDTGPEIEVVGGVLVALSIRDVIFETFRSSLQQKLASITGVGNSLVEIQVVNGSVGTNMTTVAAAIAVPATTTAVEVAGNLRTELASLNSTFTALGVTVEELPHVEVIGSAAAGSQPVAIIPINPVAGAGGRRRMAPRSSESIYFQFSSLISSSANFDPSFRWTNACPNSTFSCQDTDGDWTDLSPYYEFSFLLAHGYSDAFGDCLAGQYSATPYSMSHVGGLFPEKYENLLPAFRQNMDNYMSSVGAEEFEDLLHNGAFSMSCYDNNYFQKDHYTCGLQNIVMGATFPGEHCKKLRDTDWITTFGGSEDFMDVFDVNSFTTEEDRVRYAEVKSECAQQLGQLSMFDALKKFKTAGYDDGFIRFGVNYTLPLVPVEEDTEEWQSSAMQGGRPYLERFKRLLEADDRQDDANKLTGTCKFEAVVTVGNPSCLDPKIVEVPEQVFIVENPEPSQKPDVSSYALDRHGFEYSEAANLWHRRGVSGCEMGCCDACFQWYCPRTTPALWMVHWDGSPVMVPRNGRYWYPFTCDQYEYTCAAPDSPYNQSSEQICGEKSVVYSDDSRIATTLETRARC